MLYCLRWLDKTNLKNKATSLRFGKGISGLFFELVVSFN